MDLTEDYSAAFRPFVEFDESGANTGPGGSHGRGGTGITNAFSAAAAATAPSPVSLLGRVPMLAWVLLGCLVLFAVSFYVYYTRRKTTTKNREGEELEALRKQLAEAREDIDALIQQHSAMAGSLRATTGQLRGVGELARSVEHGLAEALDSWSQTVQELRSEFEVVAVEEEAHQQQIQQQAHQQQQQQHEEGDAQEEEEEEAEQTEDQQM